MKYRRQPGHFLSSKVYLRYLFQIVQNRQFTLSYILQLKHTKLFALQHLVPGYGFNCVKVVRYVYGYEVKLKRLHTAFIALTEKIFYPNTETFCIACSMDVFP